MPKTAKQPESASIKELLQNNYLFRELNEDWIWDCLSLPNLKVEKLYSSRPVYTAFRPGADLNCLYAVVSGGPVIIRSTPLDRVIAISYPGGCFGMRNLPLSYGEVSRAFPSLVEAYKTTDVIKIPVEAVQAIYEKSEIFRDRYNLLFELREKFQYHLLNCSTYPPQAVAALMRALVYQERSLGNQPDPKGIYVFDLPVDVIAHATQLNHRTVEQVLKGMQQIKLLESPKASDISSDIVRVSDPEGLKEVYSATRDKVGWWPLR
ncbi:MAG TPA: cAMP-binding protein [Cyanobacteria bacterium UBA12227]|nr:cAMP-binding protein [Cyanobacteria bacterium UBA12227]HAX86063.1 cAMP-binding protein [Cyanobacteria bacterium UBA11370]HBY79182.1 cAMP-binding protein [Cyanobacteria bacterium UBA11148]